MLNSGKPLTHVQHSLKYNKVHCVCTSKFGPYTIWYTNKCLDRQLIMVITIDKTTDPHHHLLLLWLLLLHWLSQRLLLLKLLIHHLLLIIHTSSHHTYNNNVNGYNVNLNNVKQCQHQQKQHLHHCNNNHVYL